MALTSHVNEGAFAARRAQDWNELDMLLRRAEHFGVKKLSAGEIARLSPLYRDLCADLAAAQAARYSAPLVDSLQTLTASAHSIVYGVSAKSSSGRSRLRRAALAFPRAVRRHRLAMAIAFVLFFLPFFVTLFISSKDPTFAFRITPESQLRELTESYRQGFSAGRDGGQSAGMAGFYVNNNVGIALRCFATGIFFGLGSAFYLISNGVSTGAVVGYVASQGAGGNIFTFICGHSSFELGAIVIAGGAGLTLGWSIVSPGEKTRAASLQNAGKDAVILAGGAAMMLFIAAAIEGFWSASSVPDEIKRAVGGTALLCVLAYLSLGGRSLDPEDAQNVKDAR
ncbi:MAG: stage II sporulation protein M [Polyangiaceae bacterium]